MIPALVVTVCCCGITQRVSDSFSSHESGGIAVCASVFREAGELHQMIYKPIDQWLLTLCWSMLIFVLIYSDIYIYGPTWCYAIQFCEGLSQFIIYSMWSQLKDWWTDVFFCILPVPWGVLQRIQWCNTCGFAGNTHQGLVGFSWGSPQLIPSNNESIIELNGICIYMIIHVHTVLIRYYPSWVNYEASSNTIAQVCSNTSDVLDKFQLAYDRTLWGLRWQS